MLVNLDAIASDSAHAGSQIDACLTYVNSGKHYHVQAISTDGSELNSATNSFSNYSMFSKYVVVFWGQNQVTVIKMQGFYLEPSFIPSQGIDQEGRLWTVQTNFMICN